MAAELSICLECPIRPRCREKDAWRAQNGYGAIVPTGELCYHDRRKAKLPVPWRFTPAAPAATSRRPAPAAQMELFR